MFKSLFHENQLIGPQKYTFVGSKSSQNASIFHEKNDGGVKFFIGYPYTAGYGGLQEYCCLYEKQIKGSIKAQIRENDFVLVYKIYFQKVFCGFPMVSHICLETTRFSEWLNKNKKTKSPL